MKSKQRNPNRLYDFYRELQEIHITYFPDIRFGQLFCNIQAKYYEEKKGDIFYVEEDKMIRYIREYAEKYGSK